MLKMPRISEIFASFQGEGFNAGMPTLWVRFFGCNLECQGFGQLTPMVPAFYEKDEYDFNVIKEMKDVPIPQFGCDSAYSWSAQFKHLASKMSPSEIVEELLKLGQERFDMNVADWTNRKTHQPIQLCFTGGEPMLNQKAMVAIIQILKDRGSKVQNVAIETNGTKEVKQSFLDFMWDEQIDLTWNVSPKLFSVSGERNAIKPEIISTYSFNYNRINIKFVVNGSEACWKELDDIMPSFLDPVLFDSDYVIYWIMPEGATAEDQRSPIIAEIANEGMKRGFYIATRNHVAVYGNVIGT